MKIAIIVTTSNRHASLAIGSVTGLSQEEVSARLEHGDVLVEGELVANPEIRRRCRDVLAVLGAFHITPEIYRLEPDGKTLRRSEENRICVTTVERLLAQWQRTTLAH